jgi:hypothetical protein
MNEQTNNPIEKSIEMLTEAGWSREEATNLMRAIKSEKSGEHLFFDVAPAWVNHCYETKNYVTNMLGLVALGLIDVSLDDNGDWLFKLNENGIKAGKMMGLK